ncbi:hypothetical protein [Mycobacterium neglectum]|jgi:hypothetical protein|uniref:hypothetical protein n=1 Tax=Mycobacterium neglectum TaxID=242737 RepID=UPI000BFEBDEE|nr:hypothetical protein [Mycobacterium neglectum]
MDPKLSPALIMAIVAPLLIIMAIAVVVERIQRRRDHADGVLMSWDDLRLTDSALIVGSRHNAQRLPLNGLHAKVDVTSSSGQVTDDEVHLTIENAGQDIHRSRPYTYGASGAAQAFAIKFNLLSGYRRSTAAAPGHTLSDRRVA